MPNPWTDDVTPDEFAEHYERRTKCIVKLTPTCIREGCDNDVWGITTRYCSNECRNVAMREAAEKLKRLMSGED